MKNFPRGSQVGRENRSAKRMPFAFRPRRRVLSQAILAGFVSTLWGVPAHAAGCTASGVVSAAGGTGPGSLVQTLPTLCTEIPTRFGGSTVSLDASVSSPASQATYVYLDVSGTPVAYTLGASGGSTYSLTSPSEGLYFSQNALSAVPAYATLVLTPAFKANLQVAPLVNSGVELKLGAPDNFSVTGPSGSGIVLSNASPVGNMLPILGFATDMNFTQSSISVITGAELDTAGHAIGISSKIYGVYGNDSLVVGGGGNLTMSGAFSTLGSLTVDSGTTLTQQSDTLSGAKTLVVDGSLDVSGIPGGVVQVNTIGGTDSAAKVHLGANTLSISQAAGAFDGVIDGSGGLSILAGTQGLDGRNTYTGTTAVAAGATLKLDGLGSIADSALVDHGVFDMSGTTAPGTVYALGGSGNVLLGQQTLTVTQASGNLSGVISGAGGLEIRAGTQTLSGANTYGGTTTVDPAATLVLSGNGSVAASALVDNGVLSLSSANNPISLPSLAGSGVVDLGGVNLNLTQASGSFDGRITGQGALNLQGGQEALGNGATLAGALQVQAAAEGIVQGQVQAGGDVTVDGRLAVGTATNPGSTLTVGGSYTQGSSATLTEQVTPTAASRLQVNGAALNLGGKLVVQAKPGPYVNRTFVLVDAPGSTKLNGSFSSWEVLGLSPSDYAMQLVYLADPQVLLTVSSINPFSAGANTPNQRQVAGVLNTAAVGAGPALSALLTQLLTAGPSLPQTLDSINGQLYSTTQQWLLQATRQQWDGLFDRLDLGAQARPARPGQAFVDVTGQRSRIYGDGNAEGVDSSASALTLGRQIRRGAWQLGAAFGTLSAGATRNHIGDGMTASMYRVGVFAARPIGVLRVGSVLGFTQGRIRYATTRRNARVLSWQTRVAHDFEWPRGDVLTPMLSLDLQRVRLGGATATDSGLGLAVPLESRTTASSLAALRLVHPWGLGALHGTLSAALGLRHWWRRPASSLRLSFDAVPGLAFTNWAVAAPRNAFEADLGFSARLRRNLDVQLAYEGEFASRLRADQLQLRLDWRF